MSKRSKNHQSATSEVNVNSLLDGFKLVLVSKTQEQKEYIKSLSENMITFVTGPAGCGKTFIAVIYALQQLAKGSIKRIILTRPMIEAAGEKMGYLPGDMVDKINPYLMPIFDTMMQVLDPELVVKLTVKNGKEPLIKVVPLAFMRGCTFRDAFVVADEMQNSAPEQVRMLLTRIGENSKMVLCGDIRQTDIRDVNGLYDAVSLLKGIDGIKTIELTEQSIVRHPIIQKIEDKYEKRAAKKAAEYNV